MRIPTKFNPELQSTTRFHDGQRYEVVRTDGSDTKLTAWRSVCPVCVSGAVIAQLIGDDTAQAGDIVVRSRSPVFALCRALLAAGANPNSKLECFRGSVLALTIKTIGIGAKLTIKENDWVGPKLVPYEPFSRDRVGRYVRQNDAPVDDHPTTSTLAGERGAGGIADIQTGRSPGIGRSGLGCTSTQKKGPTMADRKLTRNQRRQIDNRREESAGST